MTMDRKPVTTISIDIFKLFELCFMNICYAVINIDIKLFRSSLIGCHTNENYLILSVN